jgi:hypothetical protein
VAQNKGGGGDGSGGENGGVIKSAASKMAAVEISVWHAYSRRCASGSGMAATLSGSAHRALLSIGGKRRRIGSGAGGVNIAASSWRAITPRHQTRILS